MGLFNANNNALLSLIAQMVFPFKAHARVHKKQMFSASHLRSNGDQVADNEEIFFVIATGDKDVHWSPDMHLGGNGEVTIYEGVSATVASTLVSHNHYRDILAAPVVTAEASVYIASTIVARGTKLQEFFLPGGTGPLAGGGEHDSFALEWILNHNTKYGVSLINRSGGVAPGSGVFNWYEKEHGSL